MKIAFIGLGIMGSDTEMLKTTHDLAREMMARRDEDAMAIVEMARARFAGRLNEIAIN